MLFYDLYALIHSCCLTEKLRNVELRKVKSCEKLVSFFSFAISLQISATTPQERPLRSRLRLQLDRAFGSFAAISTVLLREVTDFHNKAASRGTGVGRNSLDYALKSVQTRSYPSRDATNYKKADKHCHLEIDISGGQAIGKGGAAARRSNGVPSMSAATSTSDRKLLYCSFRNISSLL